MNGVACCLDEGGAVNILYIDHYFGSPSMGMEFRPYYFARQWVREGHNVLCVGASFSHLRSKQPEQIGRCLIDGLDYLILKTRKYQGNGIRRVLNMLDFMRGLFSRARQEVMVFKPDLVIASSTYTWDNWAAAWYARKCNAKYIYELHDVWPLSPMELGGMSKWHPFIWLLQRAENFACKHADKIISVLPAADGHLVEHGMSPKKFAYIPNGILPEEWTSTVGVLKRVPDHKFTVGYVGGHALSNALDTLCDAAERLPDVEFVLVGKGAEKQSLVERCRQLKNVRFRDPVPKAEVPKILAEFDCLYIGWKRSPLYRFGISPNKVYDYMMSGTPIVHAVDAANDPVKDAECGISCEPESVEALISAILQIHRMSEDDRRGMGMNGRKYVMKHNLLPDLANEYLKCVDVCC